MFEENEALRRSQGLMVLRFMGKDILKPIPQLINIIYENEQRTTHFTDVTMIVLKKNKKTTKCTEPAQQAPTHIKQS